MGREGEANNSRIKNSFYPVMFELYDQLLNSNNHKKERELVSWNFK